MVKKVYVKLKKVEQIRGNFDDLVNNKWYKVESMESSSMYLIGDNGIIYLSTDELKFIKKIKGVVGNEC